MIFKDQFIQCFMQNLQKDVIEYNLPLMDLKLRAKKSVKPHLQTLHSNTPHEVGGFCMRFIFGTKKVLDLIYTPN